MKPSTDHLPEWKQQELRSVVNAIRAASDDIAMVILYGSYARGDYKEVGDLAADRKSGHVSDYDILAITGQGQTAYDTVLWEDVALECRRLGLSAQVRIIAHDLEFVNNRLAEGQFFFKDVDRDGRLLYDSGDFTLAKEKHLSTEEQLRLAQEHFQHWYERAQRFYKHFEVDVADKDFKGAAFQLQQSTEAAYKTVLLVLTNYCPHEHYLGVLGLMAQEHDARLAGIFSQNTEAEQELFKRFDYAYIGARYDPKYEISAKELNILCHGVENLLSLTEEISQEHLAQLGR